MFQSFCEACHVSRLIHAIPEQLWLNLAAPVRANHDTLTVCRSSAVCRVESACDCNAAQCPV